MRLVLSLVGRHFKGCVNVDSMVRKYCSLMRDDNVLAQHSLCETISLRDTADRNSGCCAMLSRNELGCIVDYLATM